MKAKDFVSEKWTEKYKKSINCSNPKGFSQKAHCAGRKKNEDATTMPDTEMPDVKQDGKLKTGLKKVGKFIGRGLGALDFVDAANKFSKGDIEGGAGSTLSGITYAVPFVGLPLGLAKDLAKEKGYDPLDYSSKSFPKGPKGETLYPITPLENKSNMLKGILIAETYSTGTTIGSAGIGGGSGLGIEASPMTKILQGQLDEAGTRAGALNTVIQLYKSIQKGGLANEIELQQRQMRALMRKYGIGYEDMGVKSPPPTPPPVTPAGTTTKTPKSWVDTLPSFDEPKPTSNYKPWEPEVFKEFVDTGGGGDSDDEMEQRVIEMYFEDGLRETEIAKLEGIPEVQVHNIIIKYLNGDRPMDEGTPEGKGKKVGEGWKGALAGGVAGGMIGGIPGALIGGTIGYGLGGANDDLPNDVESAYELGQQAARNGETEDDNPYEEGMFGPSEAMEAWHEGWESVQQEVDEGAPELLKKEMPLVRHIDKILAGHGYKKGTPEYDEHFKQLMAYLRKFGNIDLINKQDVAEGHADQQRKVFKKNGKPVGEVGIDRESSPGVGQWYMKCYAYDIDYSGYDSYEEAVAELKHCLKQDVAEGEVSIKEYGGYETKRIIQYSKDNPPNMDYLYQQFVQRMLNPENTVDPDDWIDQVNKFYNLNFKWRDYQERGKKDHTNNWQRIIQRYVVQRP